jgi:hypothetical protein
LQKQEEFIKRYNMLKSTIKDDEIMVFGDSVHPQHQTRLAYGWIKKRIRKAEKMTAFTSPFAGTYPLQLTMHYDWNVVPLRPQSITIGQGPGQATLSVSPPSFLIKANGVPRTLTVTNVSANTAHGISYAYYPGSVRVSVAGTCAMSVNDLPPGQSCILTIASQGGLPAGSPVTVGAFFNK